MSYTILNNDGTLLLRVANDSIDQSTSVTFVGRDYPGYGQFYNQNLVTLLTNSASANYNVPENPLTGQLWYDTTFNRLRIYNGASFVTAGGAILSGSTPSGLGAGDFWYDTSNKLLNFFNGASYDTVFSYPINQATGWVVPSPTVLDNNTPGVSQQVTLIENYNNVIGLLSQSSFTASVNDSSNPSRFANAGSPVFQIYQGLNILGNIASTATLFGNSLSIRYDGVFGGSLYLNNGNLTVQQILATSIVVNHDFKVYGPSTLASVSATSLVVSGITTITGILYAGSDVRIAGNLYVDGTQTIIDATRITSGDAIITLSTGSTSALAAANSGLQIGSTSSPYISWLYDGLANWVSSSGIKVNSFVLSNNTNSGALQVVGGVGIGGGLVVGNNITATSLIITGQTTLNSLNAAITTVTQLTVSGNETISGTLGVTGKSTLGTLAATLTTVTQLTVSGNETISGTLGVTGQSTLNALAATLTTVTQLTVSGQTLISNATLSMSTNTGALVITGGVGIGGALYVGSTATHYGHILPAQSNTYNLGSPTQQWGALYVNTQTIYMGGIAVTVINTGSTATLTVGGSQVITTATVANYTAARSLAYAIAFG